MISCRNIISTILWPVPTACTNLPRELITVTLDPDVAAVFTTLESVNQILRALITVIRFAGI